MRLTEFAEAEAAPHTSSASEEPSPPRVERERALPQPSGPDTAEQSEEQTSLALKGPHPQSDPPVVYGAPEWAGTSRVGLFAGADAGAATRRHAPLSNQPPALPTRTAS